MCRSLRVQRRRAFSMLELIVVLAVLMALLGMFLPLIQRARVSAAQEQSAHNIMQMCLAMHGCQDVYKKLPPAIGWYPVDQPGWKTPAGHGTAFYHILPFLEADNVYHNTTGFSANSGPTVVKTFLAPNDFTAPANGLHSGNRGAVSYAVNGYALMKYRNLVNNGYNTWGYTGRLKDGENRSSTSLPKIVAQDGTANTIAFGERLAACQVPLVNKNGQVTGYRAFECVWGQDLQNYNNFSPAILRPVLKGRHQQVEVPLELMPQFGAIKTTCEPATYQAFGSVPLQVGMYDASVRSVNAGISLETWTNLLLPDDGNVIGPDF